MTNRSNIRTLVRGAYDLQKLRVSVGNRVVGNFRAKLGQEPGKLAAETLDAEAQKLLADLKARYKRLADGVAKPGGRRKFKGDEVISTYTEFALVAQYTELEHDEVAHFRRLGRVLEEIPIHTEFLAGIKGIGPAMAGVIVSEFDITKARYASSLWKYAGLDVATVDGLGRSRRREHLEKRQYKNAKGEEAERDSITYNPWLKTKLMGVLAPSFLRSGSDYRRYYDDYRHRIETDPNRIITDKPGFHRDNTWTKQRRHDAAQRYMLKCFLVDLYRTWRTLEGLPVVPSYEEARRGYPHGGERAA